MRTRQLLIVTLWALQPTSVLAYSLDKPWFIFGSDAGKDEKNWTKYVSPGPRDAPFPVIWLAQKPLKIRGYPEASITLNEAEYSALKRFTDKTRCASSRPNNPAWGDIEISRSIRGRLAPICYLPQHEACYYIGGVMARIDIRWSKTKLEPLSNLWHAMKCA